MPDIRRIAEHRVGAQRHVRAAVCRFCQTSHDPRPVGQSRLCRRRRRHPAQRPRATTHPVGGPPDPLRPGALPHPRRHVPPGDLRPRRLALRLLPWPGRDHRPRDATQPGRPPRLGQRGGRLRPVQPHEGRQDASRIGWRLHAPPSAPRGTPGGCSATAPPTHAGPTGSTCPERRRQVTPGGGRAENSRRRLPYRMILRSRANPLVHVGEAGVERCQAHPQPVRRAEVRDHVGRLERLADLPRVRVVQGDVGAPAVGVARGGQREALRRPARRRPGRSA